ncbi:MAG TPA: hypothetical protein VLT57_07525, partial [Bryobacteraceae bacterium]|nr:hypothetical protein [Bryobacteraceae bacterium]
MTDPQRSPERLDCERRQQSCEVNGQKSDKCVLAGGVACVRHQQGDDRNCDGGNGDPEPDTLWMKGVHSGWSEYS